MLEKKLNQVHSQLIETKSKEFEAQFTIDALRKRVLKLQESNKALATELGGFKSLTAREQHENQQLHARIEDIDVQMAGFKQRIFEQRSQSKQVVEVQRRQLKSFELFQNQKLDRIKQICTQIKSDLLKHKYDDASFLQSISSILQLIKSEPPTAQPRSHSGEPVRL